MDLEAEVKKAIGNWDINLVGLHSENVSYSDLVRPLLYGIGVDIAEKLVNEIYQRAGATPPKQLLDLNFHDAATKFKKEYLVRNLKKQNFSGVDTATAIGLANSREDARVSLAGILKREFGVTVKKIKDEVKDYKYAESFKISDRELKDFAVQEMERYSSLFRASLFRSLIIDKSRIIAKPLVEIAMKYTEQHSPVDLFDKPYHAAIAGFKTWYLMQQIKLNGSGKQAAEKSGLSEEAFRQAIFNRGIKIAEVLSD